MSKLKQKIQKSNKIYHQPAAGSAKRYLSNRPSSIQGTSYNEKQKKKEHNSKKNIVKNYASAIASFVTMKVGAQHVQDVCSNYQINLASFKDWVSYKKGFIKGL